MKKTSFTSLFLCSIYITSSLYFYQSGYEIRDLESTTQAEFQQETMAWTGPTGIGVPYDTDCNSVYLMGGYGYAMNSASFQRKYENLPSHSFIILTYEAYIIDAVGGEVPVQSVGTAANPTMIPVYPFALAAPLPTLPNDFCGSGGINDAGPITVLQVVPHSDSTLYFNWAMSCANLGIRNIKILIVVSDLSAVTSCNIANPLALVSGFDCQCSTGLYSASCVACDDACGDCYSSGPGSCYTINDGYYFDGTNSNQCDSSCGTCSGPDPNECLTCAWGGPADANNECVCNDGYYFDGTSSCLSCDWTCKTCFGAGANSCDTCNDGTYLDGVANSCLDCDSSCKTCSGPGANACLLCPWGDPADANSECNTPAVKASTKTITDIKTKTQTVVGAGLIANTLVKSGSSGAIRISMLAQMIQYIKYLDIDYPYDVRYAISNWDNNFINFGDDDADMTPNSLANYGSAYGSLPSPITMYDDDIDPSFLINFWQQLITLFIVSGLLIFMAVVEVIVSRKAIGKTSKKMVQRLRICFQGLLITYLYDDFADILFFAILSYRATKEATALTIVNIIVSILFLIITVGILIAHNWLIKKYQSIKSKDQEKFEKFESKIEGAKILWKDCKEDSFLQMNAVFFAVLHNILFCFILAMLYERPLAQVILINILSLTMLVYLLWFRPLDETQELIQMIILEALLFAVNICLLVLMVVDSNSKSREGVGEAILILTLIFNFIPLIFLAITLILMAVKIYHAIKAYQLKRKLERLKKTGVNIKKSQVAPIEVVKDDVSISTKYNGNIEFTQTNSLVLGPQSSHATNLLSPESRDQSNFRLSPLKATLNLGGLSDNEDQLLKGEDGVDSKRDSAKFSKTSLLVNRQQNLLRKVVHLKAQIPNNSQVLDCESQSLAEQ